MVRKKCKKLMNDQNFEEGKFMDFFGVLTMLGGLALFLYGMETMGKGLEKLSGGRLERILEKLKILNFYFTNFPTHLPSFINLFADSIKSFI